MEKLTHQETSRTTSGGKTGIIAIIQDSATLEKKQQNNQKQDSLNNNNVVNIFQKGFLIVKCHSCTFCIQNYRRHLCMSILLPLIVWIMSMK